MADIDFNTMTGNDRGVVVQALQLAIALLETLPAVGRENDVERMRRVLSHPALNFKADDAATKDELLLRGAIERAINQRKTS
jgi:hypothetical protein